MGRIFVTTRLLMCEVPLKTSKPLLMPPRPEATEHPWLDWINVGLMLAAWAAAQVAPFQVFLFAYAVLGPLHYATEISWLHDRGYFLKVTSLRNWWLALVSVTMVLLIYGFVMTDLLGKPVPPKYEVSMVYLVLVTAGLAQFIRRASIGAGLFAVTCLLIAILSEQRGFFVLAYFLVTIIHVLIFTAAFVLYGAMKTRSRSGLLSLAVFAVCVTGCLLVASPSIAATADARLAYRTFEPLNVQLALLFGQPATAIYDSDTGLAIMRLIAFAYTYHYLNWFSKTSIIGWHQISTSRALAIGLFWVASIGLYITSYSMGLAVLYAASLLHVLLEFPLNIHTAAGIGRLVWSRPDNRSMT